MLDALDTIIGMLFVFLTFSLLVSAAQEVIAATLRLRGKNLKRGLDTLLTNLDQKGLADLFWAHPFIKSLQTSAKPPSYIPSTNVAAAVMHMASGKAAGEAVADVAALKTGLTGFTHKNLATIVATVIEQCGAGATLAQVQTGLEKWADSMMERVSSRYSSETRLWLFCVALALAALLNIDTVTIWQRVQSDKVLRDSLVVLAEKARLSDDAAKDAAITHDKNAQAANKKAAVAEADAKDKELKAGAAVEDKKPQAQTEAQKAAQEAAIAKADTVQADEVAKAALKDVETAAKNYQKQLTALNDLGLPIGWTDEARKEYSNWCGCPGFLNCLLHLAGIVASGFAASLGAPFWFDLLQRFMNIRSSLKPKKPEELSL